MIPQSISLYRILEKLGAGGMGESISPKTPRLNRKVAIKFLPEHLIAESASKEAVHSRGSSSGGAGS